MLGKRLKGNTPSYSNCHLLLITRVKDYKIMIKGLLLICSYLLIYSQLSVLGMACFIIQIIVCLSAVLGDIQRCQTQSSREAVMHVPIILFKDIYVHVHL